jgi:hypothetical protein
MDNTLVVVIKLFWGRLDRFLSVYIVKNNRESALYNENTSNKIYSYDNRTH